MAGYQELDVLLLEELDQLQQEGKLFDRPATEARIRCANKDRVALMEIYEMLCQLPDDSSFLYQEPDEYDQIEALAKPDCRCTPVEDEKLYQKLYGAWYGRCIGCALGQPVELWRAQDIQTWCEKADAWPLHFFIPTHSRAEQEDQMRLNSTICTDENIRYMPTDDDIRYTVCGLNLVKANGLDFDAWTVGSSWLYTLPFRALCTAENQAYLNFVRVDENGPWGRPEHAMDYLRRDRVNTYLNPYREWIGAQIRVDSYGYIAAGDPHTAARMAYHDASFSHVKNGVYGAMFFAALIAAAVTESCLDNAIERAMCEIPATSRFYEAMRRALEIADTAPDGQTMLNRINKAFEAYNAVHTINNAALCLAAIRYSGGNFHKALTLAVMGGMDTDCNGATVGSVMGAFCGIDQIPESWKMPLHDQLYSGILEYHPVAISQIAKETCEVHRRYYPQTPHPNK